MERLDLFLNRHGLEPEIFSRETDVAFEYGCWTSAPPRIGKNRFSWTEEELHSAVEWLEKEHKDWLDANADHDELSTWDLQHWGRHAIGFHLLEELPDEEIRKLGLAIVDGDHPGSNFYAVHCEASAGELAVAVARAGMNIVVTSCE